MKKATSLFDKQKQESLAGVDLSRKGSIDDAILDLVKFINNHDNYFTTSSCSGRVCLFEDNPHTENKKSGCRWLYTTHGFCDQQELITGMKDSKGNAYFKFEPFVLHVQCRALEDGQLMHEAAIAAGYRNSGLSISRKGKIISAVRSTHSMEVPVSKNGKSLVSEEYVDFLVGLANEKMETNFNNIQRFHSTLADKLLEKKKDISDKTGKVKKDRGDRPEEKKSVKTSSVKDSENSVDDYFDATDFDMFTNTTT